MTQMAGTSVAMWSGPRNISTAMMYAFANRSDCIAWDEPFYGAYLIETGLAHPMAQEITDANECDWRAVAAACAQVSTKPVFYQKHMTQHLLPSFDRSFIRTLTNAFLIRSPEKVLSSYAKKHDDVSLHAIGFIEQAQIFDLVAQHLGHAPPVVDADLHLASPRESLQKLCAALTISFEESMLQWPKGPKTCDGVRAPHWYNAAWASTGFEKSQNAPISLPSPLQRIADEARPFYERLLKHSL